MSASITSIRAIIFDLGAVLIDWDPYRLYRKILGSDKEIADFLTNVCTMDWNEEQDMGRSLQEGTEWLVNKHPDQADYIRAYYGRWEEMLGDAIPGTLEIFNRLRADNRYKIYALSNWSAETFGIAQERYSFLKEFDGIVLSGQEKTRKPFPDFYNILLERYSLKPTECLFIDDNLRNVLAARELGIDSIHFVGAKELEQELRKKNVF